MIRLAATKQWQLTTTSRRIPADAADQYLQSCDLLTKAREIHDQALENATDLQTQAYTEGYQSGLRQAQQELLESMLTATADTRRFQDNQEKHILTLAVAIVQRMLPKLSAEELLLSMLREAFSELQGERQLQVYVNPAQRSITETWLKQWRLEHPDISRLEVAEDPDLDLLSCRVESELGVLSVDPLKVLDSLQQAGDDTSASTR